MTPQTQTATITNGVNVTQLGENINLIQNDPTLANFKFKCKNKWITGGHNRSTIKNYYGVGQEHTDRPEFQFDNGEPPVLLGNDEGANPVEYILNALAGCMTTTMVYHAAAQGIKVESIESELEGNLDLQGFLNINDAVRKGYKDIKITFKVKSDATKEQLEELAKNSPVYDIISNPVPVNIHVDKV